jgi:hypothetical protein
MATRLIGVDSEAPRLPDSVIAATQGTTAADLAPGDVLADAYAYTDAAIVDVIAGGVDYATDTETITGTSTTKVVTPAGLGVITPRFVPTTATNAEIQTILDTGHPWVVFNGDYTLTLTSAAHTLRPAAGQRVTMWPGSTLTFGSSGPYYCAFLVTEDDVTIDGFRVVYTGDYVTLDTATGRYNAYGAPAIPGWGFSSFIAAFGCDLLKVSDIVMAGNSHSTACFNSVVTGATLTRFDIHDIDSTDHCAAIYIYGGAGSECDGAVRRVTGHHQSTKSMLHYGPGHVVYLGSAGPFEVHDITDTGELNTYSGTAFDASAFTGIDDGHTVKVRSLGLTTKPSAISNVSSRRAAGCCDVVGWNGMNVSRLRYVYTGAHPGLTAGSSIVGVRKSGSETTNNQVRLSDVHITIDAGDIPLIIFRADYSRLTNCKTILTPTANRTEPVIYWTGTRTEIDLVVTNKAVPTFTTKHAVVESGTSYSEFKLCCPAGFKDYPPRVSFLGASGGIAQSRFDFVGQRLYHGGWDSATIVLDTMTLDQLLINNELLVDGRYHFLRRSASTTATISITQQLGLGIDFSGLVMFHLGQTNQASGVAGLYWIMYDNHSNDYTTTQLIGTQVVKAASGNQPSTFTVAVDNVGVATIGATRSGTVALDLYWSAQPLIALNQG